MIGVCPVFVIDYNVIPIDLIWLTATHPGYRVCMDIRIQLSELLVVLMCLAGKEPFVLIIAL